jgi:asparagine synthase (glutamine-hydrolysing)
MLPAFLRRRIVGPLLQAMPDSFTYKSIAQKARWVHQLALLPGVGERYAEATCFFRFTHQAKQALFSDKLWAQVGQRNSADVIVEHFAEADSDDLIDQMLYADYMTKLPEHTLMMTDRMTMAHSLELRSPLVDHELVEYLAAFPSHLKIRKGELKYALRRVGRAYLPPAILQRHKQGFMFPVAYWFRNELHGFLRAILLDSPFVQAGLFRRSYVQQLLDEHRRNQVDHHVRLWMLLNLVIWHQLYIEQAPVAAVTERLHTYVNADKRRFATVSTPVSQLQKM